MAKVLVFGTFDGLNPGHVFFLKQASSFGDKIVALVLGDDTAMWLKGRYPTLPLDKRLEALRSLPMKITAVQEDVRNSWRSLTRIKPDVIVLGVDQAHWRNRLEKLLAKYDLSPRIEVLTERYTGEQAA